MMTMTLDELLQQVREMVGEGLIVSGEFSLENDIKEVTLSTIECLRQRRPLPWTKEFAYTGIRRLTLTLTIQERQHGGQGDPPPATPELR